MYQIVEDCLGESFDISDYDNSLDTYLENLFYTDFSFLQFRTFKSFKCLWR